MGWIVGPSDDSDEREVTIDRFHVMFAVVVPLLGPRGNQLRLRMDRCRDALVG